MSDICEKDWKIVRSMKEGILNLACERILEKVSQIIENDRITPHARYLKLWQALRSEDENIAIMFNDLRRSSAIQQLASWKLNKLITDDEMNSFTQETKEKVRSLIDLWR